MIETLAAEFIVSHLPVAMQFIIAVIFTFAAWQYRKNHNADAKAHGDILTELKKISTAINDLKSADQRASDRIARLESRIGEAERDIKDLLKNPQRATGG